MSSRLLTRTRPRLTNTPSFSESSDAVVASVVHTISLSGQPTSPEIDLHEARNSPTATLSDLISKRMQEDLSRKFVQNTVSQALRTVSSMSPIAPKQVAAHDYSGASDTPIDISIARTAGTLPSWHQHYRAGPSELLAVPYDKMRQPSADIPEDIAPSVHLDHRDITDKGQQRPITAKYLPITEEGCTDSDRSLKVSSRAHSPPNRIFLPVPNQTPPPYAASLGFNRTVMQESLSPPSNNIDLHEVIAHVDRYAKATPSRVDNVQPISIIKTVLANRVPAPAVVQPTYFDRPIEPQSATYPEIIPVASKPEPVLVLPSAESAPPIVQHTSPANDPTISPTNILEIVSIKDPREHKPDPTQEPEPLSVLIQKAILRQHKEKLEKVPDKMTEIAIRAQQMKGAYDIGNRPSQPIDVMTPIAALPPCLGQPTEQISSITLSDSSKDMGSKTGPVVSIVQMSSKRETNVKSSKRSSKKRYSRRSPSPESDSSSYYYYSSYSEDEDEKVKWLSLGKDLANYPLYVTKYSRCGKCQHKAGHTVEKASTEHKSDVSRNSDMRHLPSESPSVEPQFNYLHGNLHARGAPEGTVSKASSLSPQLIVHQATLPISDETKLIEDLIPAYQITRVQHTIAQRHSATRESDPHAKEIIIAAIRRDPGSTPVSNMPASNELAHTSNQAAPTLNLNYNTSGFTTQDPDTVDYNEVLFILSREKEKAYVDDTPNSTPFSTKGKLPPRAIREAPLSVSTPAYNAASIKQEAPRTVRTTPSQVQSPEKHSADNREEIKAVLAHPFRPSGALMVTKPDSKAPSDLSYLSCINNIMEMHSVSAISDTPERFQHYRNDSSITSASLQHASSYLSPVPHFYTRSELLTPDMREETFSNLEEGEIPTTYQYIHEGLAHLSHPYLSQNMSIASTPTVEGEQEIPSLVELANCSLTPEEDLVLAKAMEALNI
ncbi:hypothetical protein QR46_1540 [Giardia duodenalis assemblage B]|uniref:Uncharacterized protein n=1 Tax=Giardia duodenalis assemblage B TaxID=1394984 RepID=A0A132NWG9_GIAIN|nr:hypothetical protein QR46_1540 [Giardia intestinalis assemblage B]